MVPAFHKLLVGVAFDGASKHLSLASQRAVRVAMALAGPTGASLTLFHSTADDGGDSERPVVQLALSEHSRAILEGIRQSCEDEGVETHLTVAADRPWLEIIRCVLAGENDFVIIAHRNDVSDEHVTRLGINSAKLLRKCPCPVLVVRPERDPGLRRVLAATDLTEVGSTAVVVGLELARVFGAEVHVVHAWQMPLELQLECTRGSVEEAERCVQEHEDGLRERIRHSISGSGGDPSRAHLHLGSCSPSRGILDAVRKLDPDLLVLGTLSRNGIPGLFMGSTAERLLDRVPCAMLGVKPAGFVSPVGR